MNEGSEGTAPEKLSQGTISSRKLLQAMSLVGLLVAILPLSAEKVSIFGISLITTGGELKIILSILLIYLLLGFLVRAITDLVGAKPSPFEKRLQSKISRETEDIKQQHIDQLANMFSPSKSENRFYSQSFDSIFNDNAINNPKYIAGMIKNTINDIHEWKHPPKNGGMSPMPGTEAMKELEREYSPILYELIESYKTRCRNRQFINCPIWFLHRLLIFLRFSFFDALAPSLISLFAIVLLLGMVDSAWILETIILFAGN